MNDDALRLARNLVDADKSIYGTHTVTLSNALLAEHEAHDRLRALVLEYIATQDALDVQAHNIGAFDQRAKVRMLLDSMLVNS